MVASSGTILGIDVGGGGARWRSVDSAGRILKAGESPAFGGQLLKPEIFKAAQLSLAGIRSETGPADAIAIGATGLSAGTEEADLLGGLLQDVFGAGRTIVMGDVELAARALTRPGDAILVYAGTGSIAACVGRDGALHTAGGKGVLIDDAGGGYWIAVTALRLLLRAEDGAPGSAWTTPLGQAFASRFGGAGWPAVRRGFYGLDRGGIGKLALAVAEAAEMGDATALSVLEAAGRELAALAHMLRTRQPASEVILAGRAAGLHPAIGRSMQTALAGVAVARIDYDGAAAAVAIARSMR